MFLLDLDVLMFLDLPCNNSFHPLYAAVQEGVTFVNITPCHHSMPIGVTSISTASRLAHPFNVSIRFGLCPFNASIKTLTMSSYPTSTEYSGHQWRHSNFHSEQGHCTEFNRFTFGALGPEIDLHLQFYIPYHWQLLIPVQCNYMYTYIYEQHRHRGFQQYHILRQHHCATF